jgi:hypothetical protein
MRCHPRSRQASLSMVMLQHSAPGPYYPTTRINLLLGHSTVVRHIPLPANRICIVQQHRLFTTPCSVLGTTGRWCRPKQPIAFGEHVSEAVDTVSQILLLLNQANPEVGNWLDTRGCRTWRSVGLLVMVLMVHVASRLLLCRE